MGSDSIIKASAGGESRGGWRSTWRRWQGLRWRTPSSALPHGLSGAASVALGTPLVAAALSGRVASIWHLEKRPHAEAPEGAMSAAVHLYLLATLANALGGFWLSSSAGQFAANMFRVAAVTQIGLLWFAWRFWNLAMPALQGRHDPWPLQAADKVAAIALLGCIAAMAVTIRNAAKSLNTMTGTGGAIAIAAGCASLLLLAGYPLQLAFGGGAQWYKCVLEQYPLQREGFVNFVYVPATWAFAIMLFGATLLMRKIISDTTFGVAFVALILCTLAATVITQEVWIPFLSTQKLIIDCPQRSDQLLTRMANTLDTSRLAHSILHLFDAKPDIPGFL
jgi:hypothetical protein